MPISLKDLIDQAGVPTTAASRVREGHVAGSDAVVTARLREAGAVLIGKTNLHEFAFGTTSDDTAFGAVRNPTPTDVHTDVEGIIGYAVPSLYYQWGEHRSTGTFFLIGAGLGLATTTYSGTIELRSAAATEVISVRDQSFSLHPAWTVFLEARWRHWGGYLSIMRARLPGDTYDTRFEDVSLYLGYRFFF